MLEILVILNIETKCFLQRALESLFIARKRMDRLVMD